MDIIVPWCIANIQVYRQMNGNLVRTTSQISSGSFSVMLTELKDGKVYDPWYAYAQSKSGNVLFSAALAQKLKSRGIQSYSLQPGRMLLP
jgi:NAD(P)-dependent dehydrogenase (short-subunit alcohol dehydrogenase family)